LLFKTKEGGFGMSEKNVILELDKPHFTVRLYEDMLKVDLKGTFKNEIEKVLENKPILKKGFGAILGVFVPLHIHLSDIDSVDVTEEWKVIVNLSHHRAIIIPLEQKESERLVSKLNELIPEAKKKELDRIIKKHKLQKIEEERREMITEEIEPGGATFPTPEPQETLEREKEAEEKIEEEIEKED
jgi:hypothetical protein